jgi:hypothetical protein
MDWDVVEAKLVDSDTMHVRFRDGVTGDVVFRPGFFRGVFAALRDAEQLGKLAVVDGVVTWQNGFLDLTPDAMHRAICERGVWVLE